MEVLENNRSKMTERVTLASLLQFIKENTQQHQPKEEIIKEKDKVKEEKVKEEKVKEEKVKEEKVIKDKSKTFEEKLVEATKPIRFLNYENIYITKYNLSSFLDSILFFFNDKTITTEMIVLGLKRFIQYGGFTEFGYSKLKWNKKMITNSIDSNSIDEYYIRSLSDYLHVNIYILHAKSDSFTFFGDFYPNRKSYVIYKFNDNFYPIFDKETIFLTSNSEFITQFLPKDKQSKLDIIDIYGPLKIPEFLPEVKIDESLIPQTDLQSVVNGFDDYDTDDDNDNDDAYKKI
jgi:hypothetical protein